MKGGPGDNEGVKSALHVTPLLACQPAWLWRHLHVLDTIHILMVSLVLNVFVSIGSGSEMSAGRKIDFSEKLGTAGCQKQMSHGLLSPHFLSSKSSRRSAVFRLLYFWVIQNAPEVPLRPFHIFLKPKSYLLQIFKVVKGPKQSPNVPRI